MWKRAVSACLVPECVMLPCDASVSWLQVSSRKHVSLHSPQFIADVYDDI